MFYKKALSACPVKPDAIVLMKLVTPDTCRKLEILDTVTGNSQALLVSVDKPVPV